MNIPVAREMRVETENLLDQVLARMGFPLVLKPISSFDAKNTEHRRYVQKVTSESELRRGFKQMLLGGPFWFRKIFSGLESASSL